MKVLHVIDSLGVGGGAEHSLANLLPLLRDRGVTSLVSTIRPRIGGLQARLDDEGYAVEVLPANDWPRRVAALRRRVRDEQPDLVHATLYNSCLISRLALPGTGVPSVDSLVSTSYDPARIEGIRAAGWKLRAARWADVITIRSVDAVHAVNGAVAEEARSVLHVPDRKITVIPRGRDRKGLGVWSAERRSATRRRLGLQDQPVVLNVGRQDHPKAQADLVRAFARVLHEVPTAVLLVAGREGDATDHLSASIKEADAGDHIRLLGHRDDVADLYVASDLLAFPSLYEGAAGSIIEAMALRCPVVGSDAAAVAEVLDHGRLGPVVRRGDVVGLADAVTRLIQDPDRRRELCDLGEAEFEHRYRIEAVADATVSLYHRLMVRTDDRRR